MRRSSFKRFAIVLAAFCAAASLALWQREVSAQGRFIDESSKRLPPGLGGAVAVAVGDFNGDGAADLILAGMQRDILLLNDGSGKFVVRELDRLPARPSFGLGAIAADIDRDGDLDIIIASGRANRILINNGSGFFIDETQQRLPISKQNAQRVAAGDINGDGNIDLFFANQNRVLINNSSGRFSEMPLPAFADPVTDGAFADVNGDGRPDLVVSSIGQNRIYINTGRGFSEETISRLPMVRGQTRGVVLADLNGDGHPDVVFANYGQNRALLNDGAGHFTDESGTRMPQRLASTRKIIAGDLDRNGRVDLLSIDSEGARLLMNDGAGNFTDQTQLRLQNAPDQCLDGALADLNGDGALDIVLVSSERIFIFINTVGPVTRPPAISGRVSDLRVGRGIANATVSSGEFSTKSAADGSFSLSEVVKGGDGTVKLDISVPPPSLLRILGPVKAPGGTVNFSSNITFSWTDISPLGAESYRAEYFFTQRGSKENFDSTVVYGTELSFDFSSGFGRAFFNALASLGPFYFRVAALDAKGGIVEQTDFVEVRFNPPTPQEGTSEAPGPADSASKE